MGERAGRQERSDISGRANGEGEGVELSDVPRKETVRGDGKRERAPRPHCRRFVIGHSEKAWNSIGSR